MSGQGELSSPFETRNSDREAFRTEVARVLGRWRSSIA